jgi:hypothetical protein
MKFHLVCFSLGICQVASFILPNKSSTTQLPSRQNLALLLADEWQGDVVSNAGGTVQGCSVQQVGDSITDWIITIDG